MKPLGNYELLLVSYIDEGENTVDKLAVKVRGGPPMIIRGLLQLLKYDVISVMDTEAATVYSLTDRGREWLNTGVKPA